MGNSTAGRLALKPTALHIAARSTSHLTRSFSATPLALKAAEPLPAEDEAVKPFEEIPTPKGLPIVGSMFDYIKDPTKAYRVLIRHIQQYGSLYKEKFGPNLPEFVIVSDPKEVEKVFRSDPKWPKRYPIQIWTDIRKERNIPCGVFLLEGETWHDQRIPISKFLLVPRKIAEYHEGFNEVSADLIKLIRHLRDSENDIVTDVPSQMNKWSFESVSLFVLGKRLGCLELEKVPEDCQEFIDELQEFLHSTQDILFGLPFHKLWATKSWKRLSNAQQKVYDIAMSYIEQKNKEIKEEDKRSIEVGEDYEAPDHVDFLTYMMHAGKMSPEEITANALDLMAAGVDTTALTLAWTLYSLGCNPEVQEKLRGEVQSVVGSDSTVTPEHIQRMPYIKDCIKETMRLYPIAPNNSRVLENDLVVSGYNVPAGKYFLFPTLAMGRLPDLFPEPDRYFPERWSRENKATINAFSSLPFGFGPRMCVGRRIAVMELYIALAQIMKTFRVQYRDPEPMEPTQKLFINPERQLNLAFIDL